MNELIIFDKICTKALCKSTSILNLRKIIEYFVPTSNQRAKMIATEITEFFFSVSSVLSVADNMNNDLYKFYYPTF
jgi:hypothetical protein